MIQIKILNHKEVAVSQGGLKGYLGKGLSALGLMDIVAVVEQKIAEQIAAQLKEKGVQADVSVTPE